MSDLVIKILNFIVECIKVFINIFTFGKFFKKEKPIDQKNVENKTQE
jgi:hypothetical protein